MSDPRGIRNNNPGNIRRSQTPWLGLAAEQNDPDYAQFTDPKYGIRALARIIKTYQRENVMTLREAVTRWAPPSDNNDTDAYIKAVCAACGVGADDRVSLTNLLPKLVPAIIQHENGVQPYSPAILNYGISLA